MLLAYVSLLFTKRPAKISLKMERMSNQMAPVAVAVTKGCRVSKGEQLKKKHLQLSCCSYRGTKR